MPKFQSAWSMPDSFAPVYQFPDSIVDCMGYRTIKQMVEEMTIAGQNFQIARGLYQSDLYPEDFDTDEMPYNPVVSKDFEFDKAYAYNQDLIQSIKDYQAEVRKARVTKEAPPDPRDSGLNVNPPSKPASPSVPPSPPATQANSSNPPSQAGQ